MAIPNIDSMTPEQARAYMSALAPTTRGTSGDYSDIDSFRSYTFSDPNYQFEDFRQLAEIAGYGKEDELASAMNISSGAGPDTFRIADPLDMGTNTGALSNLDDGVQLSPLNTTFEEDVLPANNVAATANLPVAQDLGEDGSPQPPPTALYGSDYSLQKMIGDETGAQAFNVDISGLIFRDPKTNRSYTYKYGENEWSTNPPSGVGFADLDLVRVVGKSRSNDDYYGVDIDPKKFTYGGRNTPEKAAQLTAEANREPGYEKGGGGLFYEYNNRTYYTPDNTGTSIPVGSTNIGRTTDSDLQLDKTFEGYVASGDVRDGVTYTSKGPPSASGKTMPPATDSFLESIGTNTPYNIGKALGLGDFILSSPPSNRFNLQPFFNQAESQGTDNFLRSQQRDVLQLIKDGEFFTALAGKPIGGPLATDPLQSLDSYFDVQLGQEGLNEVLSQLQGLDDNDPTTGIDPSFEVDPFDTDSSSQVASISGDDEGTDPDEDPDADPETPEETDSFTVRAFKGGGLGPYATNYIFQRFGYRPQQTIDLNLTYDPVEKLYFFEDGSPVDPKFLENMQLTRLDEDGNVVYDEENNPVTMPRVVVNEDETTSEE
jgi:hypothetical protein